MTDGFAYPTGIDSHANTGADIVAAARVALQAKG